MNEDKRHTDLLSEIVNTKKQLVLKIEQSSDYVYPNEQYEYTIYCHNASTEDIKDVHIQVISPINISLHEDYNEQGVEIGDLLQQQSHLLKLKARCTTTGTFTVHFLCYGKNTGLFTQKLEIKCDYNIYNAETTHRIHVYNFTPYEEKYILQSEDYSEDATRLRKIQKLPYKAKQNPFSFIKNDPSNGFIIDESQLYINQKNELYGDPVNTDEHNYQYLERENFNKSSIEMFEGHNLIDIINQINNESKLFRATFLQTGSNHLLNDFKQYNPNGFIYRFGLMSSELFHYLGVLPEYSYMNDLLFRWAPDGSEPQNIYPKKVAMKWNTKKWAGHGYQVFKTYTDEYQNEIINSPDFTPLFEYVHHFESLETAQEYINKEYEFDTTNVYYIETPDGVEGIRKYQYIIKESYFDTGVFFVHIPLSKIPSNFQIPSSDELTSIIQKTKPYGMKPLIRFIHTTRFRHNMSFKAYPKIKSHIPIHLGYYDRLRYTITTYKYNNVTEDICYTDSDGTHTTSRESIKLIPDGKLITNKYHFEQPQKFNAYIKEPRSHNPLKMDFQLNANLMQCQLANRLIYLNDLTEILYQKNFENISFVMKDVPSLKHLSNSNTQVPEINSVTYKLWIQSLNDDRHSRIWDYDENEMNFVELSLINKQITQPKIETGIGFMDSSNKYHGISAEYNENKELFDIKYATSINDKFKVHKTICGDIVGLAYKVIKKENGQNIVLFFIKQNKNQEIVYNYFHHIIIGSIKTIFGFIRNEHDISSIGDLSNIIFIPKDTRMNPKLVFNTPQYYDIQKYDPKIIITDNLNPWSNLLRIDKNEYSYANIHNLENTTQGVDSIKLHFDDVNIPDDAIVKEINMHIVAETNANKSIYYSMRNQDGFVTPESAINKISLYPLDLQNYPSFNQNTSYYEEQYNVAVEKDVQNSVEYFADKIKENTQFNNNTNLSASFMEDIDDYITIKKSFWTDMFDFTNEDYQCNDISDIQFVIEGYNHGEAVSLISQLSYQNNEALPTQITIPSGYFVKYIPLNYYNNFILSDTHLKFRFANINDDIDIFDTHINVTFKDKQNTPISFDEYNTINISKKNKINLPLLKNECLGYQIQNGFTTQLEFDDLEAGEYYRIYSIEVEMVYHNQSIDLLINQDNFRNVTYANDFISVSGKVSEDAYFSGMFFDDMASSSQLNSTPRAETRGIELMDTLYQSFVANSDNITSITLFPNGFVGNPGLNLKIALYENQGYTPGKLIKEINASGWSKANDKLKNEEVITYNFNVNNLDIGKTYWFKIQVENPSENNYYLLDYFAEPQADCKLLTKINNNLINTLSSLKFQINSIDLYKSFNNIPSSQDVLNNPNIYIGLHRGQGYISNLKIRKVLE